MEGRGSEREGVDGWAKGKKGGERERKRTLGKSEGYFRVVL